MTPLKFHKDFNFWKNDEKQLFEIKRKLRFWSKIEIVIEILAKN